MQIKMQELNIAFILGMLLGNTYAAVLQIPVTGINIFRVKLKKSIESEIQNVLQKRREGLPVTTRWKIYNYATSYTVELGETITENIFKPLFQEEMSDHVDVTLSPSLKPTVDLQRSEVNGRSLNTMTLLNQKSTLIPRSMDRHVSNLLNSLMGGFGK